MVTGVREFSPCQMLVFINILLACHEGIKSYIRVEKGPMTEPVVFFIGHLGLHSL